MDVLRAGHPEGATVPWLCHAEFCCETQTQTSQAGLVELRVSRNNRLGFGGGFGRARSSARWESEGGNLKREAMQSVGVEGLLSSLLSAESWASDKPLITVLTARFSARAGARRIFLGLFPPI